MKNKPKLFTGVICLAVVFGGVWVWDEVTLTQEEMLQDASWLIKTITDVHPAFADGVSIEYEEVFQNMIARIESSRLSKEEFYFTLSQAVASLNDAHTNLRMNFKPKGINIPLVWLADGLYVFQPYEALQAGDKILSIGGLSEQELLSKLSTFVSAENRYWVKAMGQKLLRYQSVLTHIGAISDKDTEVALLVSRNGEQHQIKVSCVEKLQQYSIREPRPWVGYEIHANDGYAYFWLDSCTMNDTYRRTLRQFFTKVIENNIPNIVFDVRYNPGGSSVVVHEFISYLNHPYYKGYSGQTRYSHLAAQQRGYDVEAGIETHGSGQRKNSLSDILFDGNVYVLTSNVTCSSGNMFAVYIKDNGFGTIVGEPTGNAPTAYGDLLIFELPNSGFKLGVSHKRFVRPDPKELPHDALYPDVLVETTIEDILNGTDPQLEAVKELIEQ